MGICSIANCWNFSKRYDKFRLGKIPPAQKVSTQPPSLTDRSFISLSLSLSLTLSHTHSHTHTQTQTHPHPLPTHTHTHSHTHAQSHTQARTHSHRYPLSSFVLHLIMSSCNNPARNMQFLQSKLVDSPVKLFLIAQLSLYNQLRYKEIMDAVQQRGSKCASHPIVTSLNLYTPKKQNPEDHYNHLELSFW